MTNSPREWPDGSAVRLDRQDPYLRLQSITIYVRDLELSLRFYLDQLGFHLVFDARIQPDRRFVTVAPPDGTANLTLVAPEPGSEQVKLIGRSTAVTFVTEDVIAKYREWTKRGVRFNFAPRLKRLKYELQVRAPQPTEPSAPSTEPAPIWGGVFTRFKDPDGNSFSLVSFDEVTHAVEAQRRALAGRLESERRAAQEIEIAKQVQARLFPQSQPPLKTLEYAGLCIQARKVGGDYYDFLSLGGDRLGFVIGDLPGLVLRSDGTVEHLDATATVLGIFKEWDCEIGECQLRPADTLALYTDGITESYNSADEQFGEPRLIEALQRHRHSSSQAARASIVDEVQRFSPHEQHDDITLIIAKHRGN